MAEKMIAEHLTERFISECQELARQKQDYEKRNPDTKKGNINRLPERSRAEAYNNTFLNFTEYTAEQTGKNRRVIQNNIRVGEKLNPEIIPGIIDMGLSKTEVYFLSGLPADTQAEVIEVLSREPGQDIKHIAEALKEAQRSGGHHRNNPAWGKYGYNVFLTEGEVPEKLPVMANSVIFFIFQNDDLHLILGWAEYAIADYTPYDLLTIDRPGKKPVYCMVFVRGRPILRPFKRYVFKSREADRIPEAFYREIERATAGTKNRIAYFKDNAQRRHGWNVPE